MSLCVLHVLQTAEGGGVVQALELARHASSCGARVTVAGPAELRHEVAGAATVLLRSPLWQRSLQIARLAGTSDLVHVHGARAATWALPVLPFGASVVTFHGLHLLRRPASSSYRRRARLLVRAISRAAGAVICVSESERSELEAVGAARRAHVVRNAVPSAPPVEPAEREAARAELALGPGELAVLLLGRLEPPKDPMTALRIAASLDADGVLLLVVGDGTLLPALRAAAGKNVRLLGHRQSVRTALAAADIVLNTALWEGASLSLLEAMWAGRPIVATDVAGNAELLGDAAVLLPPGDVAGFRHALLDLRDGEARARLAAAGSARVRSEFSLERMLEQTDAVYATVAGKALW